MTFQPGKAIGVEAFLPEEVRGQKVTLHVMFDGADHPVDSETVSLSGLLAFFDNLSPELLIGVVGPVHVTFTDARGVIVASGTFSIVSGTT